MKLKNIGSNQTELATNGTVVFFSYETPVAAMLPSGRYVKTNTTYSVTTTKHVNKWLKGVMADVETVAQSFIDNLTNEVSQ
jgi:phage terminase large subunit-like protein